MGVTEAKEVVEHEAGAAFFLVVVAASFLVVVAEIEVVVVAGLQRIMNVLKAEVDTPDQNAELEVLASEGLDAWEAA